MSLLQNKNRKKLLLITLAIVVLPLAIYFATRGNKESEIDFFSEGENAPTEHVMDAYVTESDSGYIVRKMMAPEVKVFRDNPDSVYSEFPQGVTMIVLNKKGETESSLSCGYALSVEKKNQFVAKNNVVVTTVKGDTLRSEHMVWDKKKKTVKSETNVHISRENEVIFGTGLEANEDFSKYKILNVRGKFNRVYEDI